MTYFVSSGGRRQDLRWDPKTNEQVLVDREEDKERKAKDPMFMLEHRQRDVNASAQLEKQVSIGALERARRAYKFDYDLNSKARAKFRVGSNCLRRLVFVCLQNKRMKNRNCVNSDQCWPMNTQTT
ncbi:hypothetical protein ACOME3_008075 [Neoechinorhynchus agilis]